MSKFGLMLLLLGTTAVLWQQAEAKPLFFLSKNFFVLTTRAPSTGSGSSYSSSSSSSLPSASSTGGLLQLPLGIISRKLGLITGLLSGFGGGGGGGFGLGFKSNVATTTRRPKKTTVPNTEFTPDASTKAYTTTTTTTTTVAPTTTTTTAAAPEEPEESTTTAATIDVKPTVSAQRPAVIAATAESETAASSNLNSGFEVIYSNSDSDGLGAFGGAFGTSGAIGGGVGSSGEFGLVGSVVGSNTFGIFGSGEGGSSADGGASLGDLTSGRPSKSGYNYNLPEDTSVNEIFSGNLSNNYLPANRYR